KLIGRAAASSGIKSHPTAAGTYTILTKNKTYHSEKYHEASMPFMERLTWDGMAIHGGNNPGRPSSHGCIHVPLDFAEKLYGITEKGDTVLISELPEAPGETVNPGLLPQQTPEPAPDPKSNVKVPRGGSPPQNVSPDATPIPTSTPPPITRSLRQTRLERFLA
ncbi:MAG: L,D-transpeptidase family protein, partial [Rhodospirillales bacterium]|nr:L,D-transpeptidase family protein [Acetobacter sp.]